MSVWYLDLDDEITDAVARLRAARDDKVVLVLAPGSRIGTGRINFRLLAREAESRGLTMAMVSGDPQVRGLSTAAGLGAYASVPEAERALGVGPAGGSVTPRSGPAAGTLPPAARISTAVGAAEGGAAALTAGMPGGSRFGGFLRRGREHDQYGVTPRTATAAATADGSVMVPPPAIGESAPVVRRGPGTTRKVATWGGRGAMVGALGAGALYMAYLTLPTATVTLIPRTVAATTQQLEIVATPDTPDTDPAARLVHAERQQFPLSTTMTFRATGTQHDLTNARGVVRFISKNTVSPVVTVREGLPVWTNGGVTFKTLKAVRLPRWDGSGERPTADVEVVATKPGPSANVGQGAVQNLPSGYEALQVSVTNPKPIDGGASDTYRYVTKADCARARSELDAALADQLRGELAGWRDPGGRLRLFAESAMTGPVTYTPECVRDEERARENFELTATGTGTAMAVVPADVAAAADGHYRLNVAPGTTVESIETTIGTPTVDADRIVFPVDVQASERRVVDGAAIAQEIRGLTVEAARAALARWGEATLVMWPDFVPSLPDDLARIELTIQ